MIAAMFSTHLPSLLSPVLVSLVLSYRLLSQVMESQWQGKMLSQSKLLELPVEVSLIQPTDAFQGCFVTVDPIISPLIQALPGYTNRVLQRSPEVGLGEKSSYMILAQSLTQAPFSLKTELVDKENLSSVYIMTLERRYRNQIAINVKRYHWLFLDHTTNGWEVVKLFSQSDSYPGYKLFPEPMDTTKGAMAEAIRLWLRDCQTQNSREKVTPDYIF